MADHEKELNTLLEDVRTIKTILQNQDAPLPRVWRAAFVASAALALVGLIQYFVPWFRSLDFDGRVLWLWFPAFLVVFPSILILLYREMHRTGKKFLGQGRIRHILFARFVIPPAALVVLWVSSRNPVFGMEGISLLVVSMWQTAIEQALPEDFRIAPLGFLGLGLVELALGWRGPEIVLLNVLLTSAAVAFAAFLFLVQERRQSGGL